MFSRSSLSITAISDTDITIGQIAINNYSLTTIGALAQLGAHNTGSVGVTGSNPVCSTIEKTLNKGICAC